MRNFNSRQFTLNDWYHQLVPGAIDSIRQQVANEALKNSLSSLRRLVVN